MRKKGKRFKFIIVMLVWSTWAIGLFMIKFTLSLLAFPGGLVIYLIGMNFYDPDKP